MRKAGLVLAVIGGVFAVLIPGSMMMQGASLAGPWGWLGVLFSLVVVVLGIVALRVEKRIFDVLLIVCAIVATVLGGPTVAIYMVLVVLGGLLALLGPIVFGPKRPSST